jgi:outer membrane receptor protein involved in Fe transport
VKLSHLLRAMTFLLSVIGPVAPLAAQDESPTPAPSGSPTPAVTPPKRQEVVVVTASRVEEELVNAPATMSVISGEALESSPAQNYGDILRTVPGMNVIQMSARDVNVTGRESTGTLANQQLVLLDGRSIYLDLFGVILWDLIPVSLSDIKQIEVVRGPASAVWGANALTGAVNIITKTPRESPGINAVVTGGLLDRDFGASEGEGMGGSYGAALSIARAPSERWSYRISGGLAHSDALARPSGTIPVSTHPLDPTEVVGGGTYPPYENSGTTQPKLDLRLDQDLGQDTQLSYTAGVAGTTGVFHSGVGPFELESGSVMGYGRVGFRKGRFRASAFANILDAEAPNRILQDPRTGDFVLGIFKTKTYDLEAGHSVLIGKHQVVTFGGNVRHNNFDISIAQQSEDRDEGGLYVQDEIFYGRFRFSLGARVDKFSILDDAVFSPRLTAMFKPGPDQSLRISYNRAFRAPSVINNSLIIETVTPVDLSPIGPLLPPPLQPAVAQPFPLIVQVVGNPDLREEELTAYEVGYTGKVGPNTTASAAYYINDRNDSINFVSLAPNEFPYTASNPPPNWPLPPSILTVLASQNIFLPQTVSTYRNLGPIRTRGLELGLEHTFRDGLSAFANYSWQGEPSPKEAPEPFPTGEISVPPTNRFNAGVSATFGQWFGTASVNYSDEAFWSDVLTAEFHGFTPSYTMFNASIGRRLSERASVALKATNITNEAIQQHVFGDALKRSIVAEVRASF